MIRSLSLLVLAVAFAAAGTGAWVASDNPNSEPPPTQPENGVAPPATLPSPDLGESVTSTIPAGAIGDGNADAGDVVTPSPPRRVEVVGIDVSAEIIDLGLAPDGTLETPTDFAQAGWWAGGTTAAEDGPTVIVGHVDSYAGPAVFHQLSELQPGEEIELTDAHGAVHQFRVTEVGLYDKTAFPTDRVYGPSDEPTLRLVTCGGNFDFEERSYEANWVVFAEQA